jgi:hypothetical protein
MASSSPSSLQLIDLLKRLTHCPSTDSSDMLPRQSLDTFLTLVNVPTQIRP